MDNAHRTPLAWLKSQRAERRLWQGQTNPNVASEDRSPAILADQRQVKPSPPLSPKVLVATLLG